MKFVRLGPGRFMLGTPEQEPNHLTNEKRHELRITRCIFVGPTRSDARPVRVFVNDSSYKTDAERGAMP